MRIDRLRRVDFGYPTTATTGEAQRGERHDRGPSNPTPINL